MSIIKTHDITLYSDAGGYKIILRPLSDEYLPLLYRWNSDPEVLYWCEGADVQMNDAETVHDIYGRTSQTAYCFLIEANDEKIGECWLQKMNIKSILELYPDTVDVRRIDMMIGEKTYWNQGIGTAIVGMLADYAFNGEHTDILHSIVYDYNARSRRAFEKNGFRIIMRLPSTESPAKAKEDLHLRLTREEYIEQRRVKAAPEKVFTLPLTEIHPSQLYISQGKMRLARDWFDPFGKADFDPIPVKLYKRHYVMTDVHTRAVLAALSGWDAVPVYWDDDALDMLAYAEDVRLCDEAGIYNPADLAGNIVSHKDYEELWRKRCACMKIPPSYAAIAARFAGLDGRDKMIIVTDNEMLPIAQKILNESMDFIREARLINLDVT